MVDSELVIVCHCKKHPKLYYMRDDEFVRPVGEEVPYIDTSCGQTWDIISDNSKMYIWGIHCPIYASLTHLRVDKEWAFSVFPNILENSARVLRPGGKIIFPQIKPVSELYDINGIQDLVNTNPAFIHKWDVSTMNASEFPFHIGYISKGGTLVNEKILLIFTKREANAGGRKNKQRKNTKRRKTKRRRTLRH